MSGETEQNVSGWSVDTLKDHLHALLDAMDRRADDREQAMRGMFQGADTRYEQRFVAQQEAVQAALLAQEKAVNAALVAADRAVIKAETASEKRFEGVNEFRGQLADQAANLMPRSEAEARLSAVAEKIVENIDSSRDARDRIREEHHRDILAIREEMQSSLARITASINIAVGRDKGVAIAWGAALGGLGLMLAIGGFILAVMR